MARRTYKTGTITGEPLSVPVYWIGRQWAVTAHGIEGRDGKYAIAADRV